MEILEHRNSSDVGGPMQSSLELGVSDRTNVGDVQSCGSQGGEEGFGLDVPPDRLQGEGMEEEQAGPLDVFHPREEQATSIVMAEALRCQVKITTRSNLHLRIANHTARDVYVRLVGHGGRNAGANTAHQRNTLEQSVVAVKDSTPLSPLKPSATHADTEQQNTEGGNLALCNDLQPPRVSMETSNLRPQTPKAEDEMEEDDEASGPLTISELVYRFKEFDIFI
ncbi:hypothetical protein PAMP_022686 [Pampus punctatissimus]